MEHRTGPDAIRIRGARQHNLKNIDVDIPRGRLTVVTGVSGSGKSSLAFDTLYAEGQRRYVESVSTYAKQFLDRLPRPDVDTITGLTPAVAIQQSAPARSARSTVGTATEIHDYLRLLFARLGVVHCVKCGAPVTADTPASIVREAGPWAEGTSVMILAPSTRPASMSWEEQVSHLLRSGFTRIWMKGKVVPLEPLPKLKGREFTVVVDRFTWREDESARLAESCEVAFRRGEGRLELKLGEADPVLRHERWECRNCGTPASAPTPNLFSFNTPLGVCPECKGFGNILTFDPALIVPDASLTLREGAIRTWSGSWKARVWPRVEAFVKEHGLSLDVPWRKLPAAARRILIEGGDGFRGVIPFLERLAEKRYEIGNRFVVRKYQTAVTCRVCGGMRLKPQALAVKLGGLSIGEVAALTVAGIVQWKDALEFTAMEREIAEPVLMELDSRLEFLTRVDLSYLTLDRLTRTLSGGEAQRIELANALGANLADTLYVLDEPTIGLHPRDTERLVGIFDDLADRGNTLVVVEHEPLVIERARHVVELGPGAGEHGGMLLFAGEGATATAADTETARYMRHEKQIHRSRRMEAPKSFLTIEGATEHNLKDITVRLPLGRMTAVTGVSGSGKSTLVEDILYRAASRKFEEAGGVAPGAHRAIRGLDQLDRVVLVDQSPIGKSPRSCPVTYMGAYAPLRAIYASQSAALARGFKDGTFSFNAPGGRCETCEGAGVVTVEMYFLADLTVPCDECGGARFKREVLEVRYRGLNIREALDLTVDQAFEHFGQEPRFTRLLHVLRRVGLGYLRLGQPANQLSGGEAQRLKVARELTGRATGHTLYLLDEPTVGLHFADVQKLLQVLDDLTERGGTVVLVEHHLDVIRNCDWIVDLGPEGGDAGGRLVAEGPPEKVRENTESHTARFLRTNTAG